MIHAMPFVSTVLCVFFSTHESGGPGGIRTLDQQVSPTANMSVDAWLCRSNLAELRAPRIVFYLLSLKKLPGCNRSPEGLTKP